MTTMSESGHLYMIEIHHAHLTYRLPPAEDDLPNMAPVDITMVDEALNSSDGLTQDDVLKSLFDNTHRRGNGLPGYESKTVSTVPLSAFKRDYDDKRGLHAIAMLKEHTRIEVDDEYKISVEDDLLHFNASIHRLDFMCTVGDSIGLWTLIPNVITDHTYVFTLDLQKPFREFKAKYSKLGFDAAGRLLHIGRRDGIDSWIAFCPLDVLAGTAPDVEVGYCTGDTRMKTKHYRMIVVFLALCLSKNPRKSIQFENPYDINIGPGDSEIRWGSNILYVLIQFSESPTERI
jgi:hypothetical protein